MTLCKHQCKTGCAIHKTRPRECRNYQCLWRVDESIPEDQRPDKLGVVIERRDSPIGPSLAVHQQKENQWQQLPTWPILQQLCKEHDCWLYAICGLDRQAIFPEWAKEAQQKFDELIVHDTAPEILGELTHPDTLPS